MEVRFYVQLVNCSVFRCFTNSASVALLDCAMSVASFDMDDWSEERFMCSCVLFFSLAGCGRSLGYRQSIVKRHLTKSRTSDISR